MATSSTSLAAAEHNASVLARRIEPPAHLDSMASSQEARSVLGSLIGDMRRTSHNCASLTIQRKVAEDHHRLFTRDEDAEVDLYKRQTLDMCEHIGGRQFDAGVALMNARTAQRHRDIPTHVPVVPIHQVTNTCRLLNKALRPQPHIMTLLVFMCGAGGLRYIQPRSFRLLPEPPPPRGSSAEQPEAQPLSHLHTRLHRGRPLHTLHSSTTTAVLSALPAFLPAVPPAARPMNPQPLAPHTAGCSASTAAPPRLHPVHSAVV